MAVLSDRIEATEGLLKELKATAYEQCRPKLPVGISGSKLSDALSGELSATNSTRDHAFSASLTTEPSSSSSRPSTPSGSRLSPRSDVGEEQSPKPPSTVGSEAKMGDSVEKEPEAHCGESEAVPSVVEGIEGTKGEAHCGESEAVASAVEGIEGRKGEAVEESTVRREKSPDSVSSGGGEKKMMLAAAAFFAARCQQEAEPTTRQEPNATSVATEPDSISTAVSPSEKSRASNDGNKADVVLKEEPSTHASGKTHQAPDVVGSPSPSDLLDQSGASSARSVDVVVAAGLDFSVADSLELEKCDFVEIITKPSTKVEQPPAAAEPKGLGLASVPAAQPKGLGLASVPQEPATASTEKEEEVKPKPPSPQATASAKLEEEKPKPASSFVTQQDELYDEEAFDDDDDISEEIDESIEGFDDSGSLPGGFESDGDAV